jgi:outer membrane protein
MGGAALNVNGIRIARRGAGVVGALVAGLFAPGAMSSPTIDFLPNLVGVGLGITPQFSGSRDNAFGAVPGVRLKIGDGNRFFEWYGPVGDINLIDSPNWQFGPALGLRLGRSDVDDAVVQKLPEIDTTIEGGIAASYYRVNTAGGVPWTMRIGTVLMTDLGDKYHGLNASVYANFWLPVSQRVFVGLGGGASWASSSFNRTYFGVTPEGAAESGLPVYQPDSGMRQYYAWPAVIFQITPQWYGGAGVFYQRLADKAADSPIVTQRGDANQLTWGVGLGYAWR